jgi:hypothetical protein
LTHSAKQYELLFQHFDFSLMILEQSLRIRSSYIAQLKDSDIIATHFIPTIIEVLRLDEGPAKAFKLDYWEVVDFFIARTSSD